MISLRRFAFHVLYVLSVSQLGSDYRITATPVLKECQPATLTWEVTPSTPFVQGMSNITLINPAPGTYEVFARDEPTCLGITHVTVAEPSANRRRR